MALDSVQVIQVGKQGPPGSGAGAAAVIFSDPAFDPTTSNVKEALLELKAGSTGGDSVSVSTVPRLVYWVYGDSTDLGTTPDATTQQSIDNLLALGIPAANIRWLYLVGAPTNTFAIQPLTSGSTIDNVTIVLSHGAFVIQDVTSGSTIDNVVIVNADVLLFAIGDITSASTIDNIVITIGSSTTAFDPTHMHADLVPLLSNGNKTITASNSLYKLARTDKTRSTGWRYIELEVTNVSGNHGAHLGIGNTSITNYAQGIFATANGIGASTIDGGVVQNNANVGNIGAQAGTGRICCLTEMATGKVWFARGVAPDPLTAHHGIVTGTLYPFVDTISVDTGTITATLKSDRADWVGVPLAGWSTWSEP